MSSPIVLLDELLGQIINQPESVEFDVVMDVIKNNYEFSSTRFVNGLGDDAIINEQGANEGSCRIFAFAQLNELTEAQTLACFGRYYRDDVLKAPEGRDHGNIRTFMRDGWKGIAFDTFPLTKK